MQPGLQSGVLVAQLEHGARLLQALVHIQLPPEGLLLLLQLPADTPWAGDRLFFALGMEDSSTAFTPACRNVLKRIEDLAIVTDLADEPFLATKTAAVDMRGGKFNDLAQERCQLSLYHLLQVSKRIQVDLLKEVFSGENSAIRQVLQ